MRRIFNFWKLNQSVSQNTRTFFLCRNFQYNGCGGLAKKQRFIQQIDRENNLFANNLLKRALKLLPSSEMSSSFQDELIQRLITRIIPVQVLERSQSKTTEVFMDRINYADYTLHYMLSMWLKFLQFSAHIFIYTYRQHI